MAPFRNLTALSLAIVLTATACTGETTFRAADAPSAGEPDDPGEIPSADDPPVGPDDTGGELDVSGRWSYEESGCEFDEPGGVEVECGWLTVPQRWDDAQDPGEVRLHVGVFAGADADRSAPPIVYLEGGPGGHALEAVPFSFDQLFGALAERREVVIFDQRGTGYNEPSLACPESTEADIENFERAEPVAVELETSLDALDECNRRLVDDGVDLGSFHTVASAHDVEALRQALGYASWNVLGISYGTRLAQTLMREHPGALESVILDSVVPIDGDIQADSGRSFARAAGELFAACASDPDCASTYPDLEERFFAVVDEADADPFRFEATNPLTAESYEFVATGDDLLGLTFSALYSRVTLAGLPELVARLEAGDTSGLSVYTGINLANSGFLSAGMFVSVICHDEVPFTTDEDYEAGRSGDPRFDRVSEGGTIDGRVFEELCDGWGAGSADPVEDQPVRSAIPTLVMAGQFDPVTPPSGGERVAAGLDRASFFLYPGVGHAAMTEPCAQQMALDFVDDPASEPDDGCVADMDPPTFVVEGIGDISLVEFSYDDAFVHASGVRPESWEDQGSGAFGRGITILDQTAIVQQVVDGVPASFVVSQLGEALGGDIDSAPTDERSIGGRDWDVYTFDIPGAIADLAVAEDDGMTFLVVMVANNDTDRSELLDELLDPVLEAIGP